MLGVEYILSVSAVGSLKEEHKPTDFVIPDQFIDRTFARQGSVFYAMALWRMSALATRFAVWSRRRFQKGCEEVGVVGKLGGTYVCMEGPQFSTRAESRICTGAGARM